MKALVFCLLAAAAAASADDGYRPQITVTKILQTTETSAGQTIVYPKVENPEVTAVLVEIPPGAETGWHKHPFPAYGYVLAGGLEVETEGGKSQRYKAGDAIAEMVNLLHNGKNTGTESVKLVMFVTGAKGLPFTVRPSAVSQ